MVSRLPLERRVRLHSTDIRWHGLAGWLREMRRVSHAYRVGDRDHSAADRLVRSLCLDDIERCFDLAAVEAAQAAFRGALRNDAPFPRLDRDILVRWLDRQRLALADQLRAAGAPDPDMRAGEIIPLVVEAELPAFAGHSRHCCATLPVATQLADADTDAAAPWRRALQAQADRYVGAALINPSPTGGLT